MSNLQQGAPLSEQDQLAADIAAAQPQNKIAEFKQLYPAYKDVPDLELADALHQKFYSDVPRDAYLSEVGLADAGGAMSTGMARDAYQKRFLADNPQANQAALDAVLAQYDKQAADRTKAAASAPTPEAAAAAKAAALKKMSPEQLVTSDFNDRLDARLKGDTPGSILPGYTPDTADYSYHQPTMFDKTAGNFMGGMIGTLLGAGSAAGHLVGADMADWDAAREQVAAEQKKRLGGDTFTGKVASLVGGVVPAMAAPEGALEQAISNAGLFAIPAFQDKMKEKLAAGESRAAAMVHAAEAFGINMVAPTVMQKGFGAVLGKAAEGAPGLGQAALQLGQAAGEGVGFSALNSSLDKATDAAFGYKNDRPWLDPEDMAVQAVGFGGMRGAHMAVQLGGAALGKSDAQRQQELLDAIGKASTVDEAIAAASAAVNAPAGGFAADQLQRLRPLESGPMTWNEATGQATPGQVQVGEKYVRTTNPDGTTGFSLVPADPLPPEGGAPAQLGTEYTRVTKADGSTGFVPVESLPGDTGGTPARIGAEYGRMQNPDGSTGMGLASANDATVWRRANDPTIPTLTDSLGKPDYPTLTDELPGQKPIPTLTDQLAPADGIPVLRDELPGQVPIPTLTDVFSSRGKDGEEWHHFPDSTGTLGIPRADMPQIRAEHRGALVNFLKARGIPHEQIELPAASLKPTQAEFSLDKVNKAHDYQDGERSILTSSDGHVLDGHHQWLASLEKDAPVKAIRLDAPIRKLLDTVREFPSVETSGGPGRSWHASEFAPRIKQTLDQLHAAGLGEHARMMEGGIESDIKHHQLTEEKVAFREDNARQTIAKKARAEGNITVPKIEPMTADRMHEVADAAPALPRQILEAAAKKWNPLADQLAKMGFKYEEVHGDAPIEAQRLKRQLQDIAQSLLGLAPRRYMDAKGHKNADPKKLKQAEDFASQQLGIKTRRYPGVDTSNPITLGRGIVDAEERRATGQRQAQLMRDRLKEANPFLHLIADHGVSAKDRADLGLEKSQNPPVPGFGPVIRKNGKRLDELALHARDAGFLTNHDIEATNDTGGTRKVADMIQRALASKEVIKTPSMMEADLPSHDQQLQEEAARLGIDAAGKTADQLYDEVAAAHSLEDARREATGAETVSEQHLIEDYADHFPAEELADARLNDDDIPFDLDDPRLSTTNHFMDEVHDETTGLQDPGSAREDRGQAAADPAQAAPEGAGRAETQGEGAGELLSSYSRDDVLKRESEAEANARAIEDERRRLEAARKKAQDEKDIRSRQDASADNFQLGQDAHDSLAGQGDIFSAPSASKEPEPASEPPKSASKAPEPATEPPKSATKAPEARTDPNPIADQLRREDPHVFSQGRVHSYDPENARPLLLIACAEGKLEGTHPAGELYQGGLFDMLRKWMPTKNPPDVYIISAKHGLVHATDLIENYEQRMTEDRARELMLKPVDSREFRTKDFSQVYVAGGKLYRDVGQVYAERLKNMGVLAPDAKVLGAVDGDGVGKIRGHLGDYLRHLDETAPANAAEIAARNDEHYQRVKQADAEARAYVDPEAGKRADYLALRDGGSVAVGDTIVRVTKDATGWAFHAEGADGKAERFQVKPASKENTAKAAADYVHQLRNPPEQVPDLGGMFDKILAEEMQAKPAEDLGDMFDAILADELQKTDQAKALQDVEHRKGDKAPPAPRKPKAEPLAEGIPLSFLKRINVDHSAYDHQAGRWETQNMPADKALRSVRDDISNLEAMLKCMKG